EDGLLADRGVADPPGPELLEQAGSGLEHAARGRDVLTEEYHAGVAVHLLGDSPGYRVTIRNDSHIRSVRYMSSSARRDRRRPTRACPPAGGGAGARLWPPRWPGRPPRRRSRRVRPAPPGRCRGRSGPPGRPAAGPGPAIPGLLRRAGTCPDRRAS